MSRLEGFSDELHYHAQRFVDAYDALALEKHRHKTAMEERLQRYEAMDMPMFLTPTTIELGVRVIASAIGTTALRTHPYLRMAWHRYHMAQELTPPNHDIDYTAANFLVDGYYEAGLLVVGKTE